jgi:hypothetical protein
MVPEPKEPPIDSSPVPEPPGLLLVGRVAKPNAIIAAAGSWARLPLPTGTDLLRSIMDDDAADVVDLSQPIDGAMTISIGGRMRINVLTAISVAVKSFDEAKLKLSAHHRLAPGANGSYAIGSIKPHAPSREDRGEPGDEGETNCVLAHAAVGARLVCGEPAALGPLVPYLSRTVAREKWSSDVHVELHPEPVRAPLNELRGSIPMIARGLMGGASPALAELIDASAGEVLDFVTDTQRLAIDAHVADSGIVADTRLELQSNKSVLARMVTMADHSGATPPAFWHLPAETDLAVFGRGSDPKLFDRPRELIANLLLEATDAGGMPEAERRSVKELIADRMLALFTNGSGLYAKGYDQAAVEKALKARQAIKPDDVAGMLEAKRVLTENVVGWHLYQVSDPIAKVGPVLKDWSSLWNRPAFMKWAESKTSKQKLARMRLAPMPAGVTLPRETVHLEVTIPRDDVDPPRAPAPNVPPARKQAPEPKAKGIPQKPLLFHVFAVPDGGATWLAFGLDAKLVAQKAAASLTSAPDAGTLGKAGAGTEALREGKLNVGGFATLRGLLVFTALTGEERSPFAFLPTLADKGGTPVVFTARAEGPSASAKAGTSSGQLTLPRAVIEDIIKVAVGSR